MPDRTFAGGTVTVSAIDTEFIRVDLVSIFWNGTAAQLVVTPGLANDNGNPSPPSIPFSDGSLLNTVLATVVVYPTVMGGADLGVPDDYIFDRRFFLPFQFSGPSRTLATSGTTGAFVADNELVVWADNGNVQGSGGRTLDTVGDVISNAIGPVDGQVALYSVGGPTAAISNATATGRPLLTTGVLSVAPIALTSEVTGDLPLANVAPIGQDRMLGRVASGVGDIQELTAAQILALLGLVGSANLRTVLLSAPTSVTTSTTASQVTGMKFASVAVGSYLVIYALMYSSDVSGTGIRYGVNYTGAGSTVHWQSMVAGAAGAHDQDAVAPINLTGSAARSFANPPPVISVSVDTANSAMVAWIFGLLTAGAVGDLELWHAGEVATGTIQTLAGSGAVLLKLG